MHCLFFCDVGRELGEEVECTSGFDRAGAVGGKNSPHAFTAATEGLDLLFRPLK